MIDEMTSVHKQKEEKIKIIKEKSTKYDALQRKKDETMARFDQVRKNDELLHAELVETNKRRKANMASTKTVIFHFINLKLFQSGITVHSYIQITNRIFLLILNYMFGNLLYII